MPYFGSMHAQFVSPPPGMGIHPVVPMQMQQQPPQQQQMQSYQQVFAVPAVMLPAAAASAQFQQQPHYINIIATPQQPNMCIATAQPQVLFTNPPTSMAMTAPALYPSGLVGSGGRGGGGTAVVHQQQQHHPPANTNANLPTPTPPQHQQQPKHEKKVILSITHPNTAENVMSKVVEENQKEADRKKKEQDENGSLD